MSDREKQPGRRKMDLRRREVGERAETRSERFRRALRKMKKPLVGLGLVSAAAPMVKETQTESAREAGTQQPGRAGDVEEALAERIGGARAESEKARRVEAAVATYGISRRLAENIYDNALEAGIDPKLAFGLVKTESGFKPRAVSHVGARGLTQVMPKTARWLMPGTRADDLFDEATNLRLGFRYLNQLVDKYKGDTKLALLAYNRGPGTVDRVLKRGGDPDNGYADKVFNHADEMEA